MQCSIKLAFCRRKPQAVEAHFAIQAKSFIPEQPRAENERKPVEALVDPHERESHPT